MDKQQRESDLKVLRKIREVLEEGRIGRALILVNREIQAKAMPLEGEIEKARIDAEREATGHASTRKFNKDAEDFRLQEEAHAKLAKEKADAS